MFVTFARNKYLMHPAVLADYLDHYLRYPVQIPKALCNFSVPRYRNLPEEKSMITILMLRIMIT